MLNLESVLRRLKAKRLADVDAKQRQVRVRLGIYRVRVGGVIRRLSYRRGNVLRL